MGALRERLGRLGLLRRDASSSDASSLGEGLDEGEGPGALLRLCEGGALEGGMSVALDVRPDELFGALCAAGGGRAREVRLVDVRERPAIELTVHFAGRDERWEVEGLEGLVHNLNDLLREDPRTRAIAELGEWGDALQLWCVEKRVLPRLLRERLFEPRNVRQLRELARVGPGGV
jgi:hypothetical protein